MANELPPVIVELQLEIDQFKSRMNQAEAQIKGLGTTAKASTSGVGALGTSFKQLAGSLGLVMGVSGVISFLKQAGHQAADDAQSFALMAAQMRISAGASEDVAKAVDAQIGKMSIAAGVVDDAIRKSYSKLVSVTHNTTDALRLQQIALDVSAAKHKDLSLVSQALARAVMGNQMALIKIAPEVKNVTDKIGYLEKSTKGLATVAANTDPYQRLTVIFDEWKEKIGYALLPTLKKLSDWMASSEGQKKMDEYAQAIISVVSAATKMAQWIAENIKWLGPLAVEVGIATAAIKLFNLAMNTNPIMLMITAVGLLAVALAGLDTAAKTGANGVSAAVNNAAIAAGQSAYDAAMKSSANYDMTPTGPVLKPGAQMKAEQARTKAYNDYIAKVKNASDETKRLLARKTTTTITPFGSGTETSATLKKQLADMKQYLLDTQKKVQAVQDENAKALLQAQSNYQDALGKATAERDTALAELEKSHADNIASINKDFTKRLTDIVQQSIDRLRNAFKSVASVDVGALFSASLTKTDSISQTLFTEMKNGIQTAVSWWGTATASAGGGVAGLISTLSDKLSASRKLINNSAALSGAGFSQTFIEQIVAQGTDMGNQIAEQILAATPDAQKQLRDLFNEVEKTADTGMDSLAKTIYDKAGLATSELKALYSSTQSELLQALADEQKAYVDQQTKILSAFDMAIAAADTALSDAIAKANSDMNDALDKLDADLTDKLLTMQGKLASLSGLIGQTQNALGGSYAYVPGTYAADYAAQLINAYGGSASVSTGNGVPSVVINNNVDTGGAPVDLNQMSVAAIKVGMPMVAV